MRKIKQFTVVFSLIVLGCSTNNDTNGNSTTTIVPIAPTSLSGTAVSTSQINLSWTDNSTNETGFKIERRTGTSNYALVGTVNADVLTFSNLELTAATNYIYRVYSYNAAGNSPTYSNEFSVTTNTTIAIPSLTTTPATTITNTSALSGGTIAFDGGATITARGVCWSTSSNPTISLSTKTIDGSGIGAFTSSLTGLTANTTYYIRAYATTNIGTAYGNQVSFIAASQYSYSYTQGGTVYDNGYSDAYTTIITNCNNQTWMSKNFSETKYSDGTLIPEVTDPIQWANLTTGAWCYYNNDYNNFNLGYGRLYNWYAVAGIYDAASLANPALRKKLAPMGWHIPNNVEMLAFLDCLGGEGTGTAGDKMKVTGVQHWINANGNATNSSGFTGIGGGLRNFASSSTTSFQNLRFQGSWWMSTQYDNTDGWELDLYGNASYAPLNHKPKEWALSVRCVKD